jgi:RNA polymerase sigma-54 factor
MWDDTKRKETKTASQKETQQFIKSKIESAKWFLDSIRQRQNTLLSVMRTIVALQEDFFKYGDNLRPMILKDVADRVSMDISTISRVVNGKYVQTNFGVYELKYFFNEGLITESGEEVSNREVENILSEIIENEDKKNPLSDLALVEALKEKGYKIARRTVSKYREQLNIPVARLRKSIF